MAEKYGWCADDKETIEIDGKKYCIFHAPVEHKKRFKTNFTTSVLKKIDSADKILQQIFKHLKNANTITVAQLLAPMNNPTVCDFSGTIFPQITFNAEKRKSKYKSFLSMLNFSKAVFTGRTDFSNCEFNGAVYFDNCEFKESVFFSTPIEFNNHKNSIFKKNASFIETIFHGTATFSGCIFEDNINLHLAKFEHSTLFNQTYFKKQIIGINTSFYERVSFSDSHINKLFFGNTVFKGMTLFSDSNYNQLLLAECSFEKIVIFDNSTFSVAAKFDRSCFYSWAYFREITFGGKVSFQDSICEKEIVIEGTDLSSVPFAKTNIESFKFIECKWGKNKFSPTYDEINQIKQKTTNEQLEEIYRRLKKNAHNNADEMQTSHWHFREKEMQRILKKDTKWIPDIIIPLFSILFFFVGLWILKVSSLQYWSIVPSFIFITFSFFLFIDTKKRSAILHWDKKKGWFSKWYLNLYYYSSGYGEQPDKAFGWLIALIFLPLSIVYICPFEFIQNKTLMSSDANLLKSWFWYLPFTKFNMNQVAPDWHNLLKPIISLLITLQAALFAFALRNKLRR